MHNSCGHVDTARRSRHARTKKSDGRPIESYAHADKERLNNPPIGLGKVVAVDGLLNTWNQMCKRGDVPNRIEVLELPSDPRYGGFFQHRAADARVRIERAEGKIHVVLEDFISPSIIERLKQQAGVLAPQVDNWRAMADSVMIDTRYDGEVFNVVLADVPQRKTDLIAGAYDLDAPAHETVVAAKVTDVIGEDVLKAEAA